MQWQASKHVYICDRIGHVECSVYVYAPAAKAGEARAAGMRPAAMEGRSALIMVAERRPSWRTAALGRAEGAGMKPIALCESVQVARS